MMYEIKEKRHHVTVLKTQMQNGKKEDVCSGCDKCENVMNLVPQSLNSDEIVLSWQKISEKMS